jgi:hypothetical protein
VRTPRRRDPRDQLNPLEYLRWVVAGDLTIMVYSLIFTLLIALDIVLHVMGIGG